MASEAREAGLQGWRHWRLTRDLDDIVWLTIDQQGERANTLGTAVITELDAAVTALEQQGARGLVLSSGKSGSFIAGADIREFDATDSASALRAQVELVHALFERFAILPFPKVAAIDGACLGGGLELALCCDWRVARDADSTRIGFPEVNLGIYPGFGGSGRSLRVAGAVEAMKLMLTGRMLTAPEARKAGLIDAVSARHGSLRWDARRAVLGNRKHRGPGVIARMASFGPARKLLAGQMRKQTASKARPEHYPAPYRLIDAFEQEGGSVAAMIRAEAENVPELLVGTTSTHLRRVYRLMERLKAEGKRSDFEARRVHVIGAGVMGGDIAAWCALRGLDVTLQDREMKYIEPAIERAQKQFARRLKRPAALAAARTRLRADVEGRGIERADVIIEAIFEDRDAKRSLFEGLRGRIQDHTIVATNTSAIPLAELADALDEPGRLIGLHFFNPVASMPLVEVVHDTGTDPRRVADGASFATAIGKHALPVTATPGFLVNRVLLPYMRAAMHLHREGIPKEALDAAAERFGMPVGPVELIDTVGLDVGLGVMKTLLGSDGDAATAEDRQLLEAMVKDGKLGKKSGEGFYSWKQDKPEKDRQAADGHDLDALAKAIIDPFLEECQACLDDGVVEDADLLDAGLIFGTGFAPFRGGPLWYRRQQSSGPTSKESGAHE
ncbi:MAG: enoyl-CoA hydratase/isomerase family protein [Gammaproteobacteria bacterium]|nr:enoyl-CoA hydratase/isomerase family protein [Gammaproteobacteria bacterium]